jgi:hypothetical protein
MTGQLPTDVELSLGDTLDPGEGVLGSVTTLAGTLVLTDHHVVIVRQGRSFRPRTGIRSWGISQAIDFRYGPPRGGMGRLMVGNGTTATSFFVKERDWDDALELVSMARRIAHRATAPTLSEAWS